MAISLRPPGLHEATAALLTDVLRLRTQHICQRGASLHGDDDPVDEAAQAREPRPVRETLECGGKVRAGTGVCQAATQFAGQLSLREATHPVERPDGAFPGPHGEREQLRHRGELGEHPRLASGRPPGEEVVRARHPEAQTDRRHHDEGHRPAIPGHEEHRAHGRTDDTAQSAPEDLLRAEAVEVRSHARPQLPAADTVGATHDPLHPAPQLAQEGTGNEADDAARRQAVVEKA